MAGGFQSSAFQSGAFQLDSASGPAFQSSAFQNSAFQTDVATAASSSSGGWWFPQPRRKTAEEIHADRIRLGIVPAPAERAIAKAARRVVRKAREQDATEKRPDPLEWLQAHHQQERALLDQQLRSMHIKSSLDDQRTYMILLQLEVQKMMQQEREDEQIIGLLMQM